MVDPTMQNNAAPRFHSKSSFNNKNYVIIN